jgi:hypothetical protein
MRRYSHLSGGTDSDPRTGGGEKSHTHRLTDDKMATRIVRKAATTEKKIIVKRIPAHVGISSNEKADELAKKGTTDGTPMQHKLQLKDLYRQTEKGRWYYDTSGRGETIPGITQAI